MHAVCQIPQSTAKGGNYLKKGGNYLSFRERSPSLCVPRIAKQGVLKTHFPVNTSQIVHMKARNNASLVSLWQCYMCMKPSNYVRKCVISCDHHVIIICLRRGAIYISGSDYVKEILKDWAIYISGLYISGLFIYLATGRGTARGDN